MAAVLNGMALSRLRPYGATFFIFSDYARPAIRLAALMELPAIFVFTHDAMGDGEDGPTHQPVEHLASMRAIPGLITLRPGDANEVVEDSFRIHGGYGFSKEYEIERLYREAPMLLIGEGTADIQRMIIGRRILEDYKLR